MYVQALAFSSKSGKMVSEYKLARSMLESVSFWWIGERETEREELPLEIVKEQSYSINYLVDR